jgi:hypothetical protein
MMGQTQKQLMKKITGFINDRIRGMKQASKLNYETVNYELGRF